MGALILAILTAACMTTMALARQVVTIGDEAVPLAAASVRTPATGSSSEGNARATIDVSNVSDGYVMCKYTGSVSKVKLQIQKTGGTTYTYNLSSSGSYEVFPLTAGNGSYSINIFENVSGNQYALAYGTTVNVALTNALSPFLYPNQQVNFNANSSAVQKGAEVTGGASGQLATVKNIYNYVINNVKYDNAKASQIVSGQIKTYIASVDSTLSSGKGICLDYAALMTAMLRSQNIPTQMRVGYVSGSVYHAWIGVYISEVGWINNAIYFDGQSWKLMDPTFASSSNQSADIMQFIGNGSNYQTLYTY